MDPKRLGRRIKAFRKLKGYTQIDFAKEIGVSIAILGAVERGTTYADEAFLQKVVDTLAITREELMLENEAK